jgi:hypothetical protein
MAGEAEGRGGGRHEGQGVRTHRGEEAGTAGAGDAAGEADAAGGLRGQAAQALALLHGLGGRPHDDALVVFEVVRVLAILGGLVQDRLELIALVAALGEEAGQLRSWEIAVAKVREELPYLYDNAGGSQKFGLLSSNEKKSIKQETLYIHSFGVVVIKAAKCQLVFFPGTVFLEDIIGETEFRSELPVRSKSVNKFHGCNLAIFVLIESPEVEYYIDSCAAIGWKNRCCRVRLRRIPEFFSILLLLLLFLLLLRWRLLRRLLQLLR